MYTVTTSKGRELSRHDSIDSARAAIVNTANVIHYSAKARREYTPQARLASAPVPYLAAMPRGDTLEDSGIDDAPAILTIGDSDNDER